MNVQHPEPLLLKFLKLENGKMQKDSLEEAMHFIRHGECGLAYDVVVDDIRHGAFKPSANGEQLLGDAGVAMGVKYPEYWRGGCG